MAPGYLGAKIEEQLKSEQEKNVLFIVPGTIYCTAVLCAGNQCDPSILRSIQLLSPYNGVYKWITLFHTNIYWYKAVSYEIFFSRIVWVETVSYEEIFPGNFGVGGVKSFLGKKTSLTRKFSGKISSGNFGSDSPSRGNFEAQDFLETRGNFTRKFWDHLIIELKSVPFPSTG